VTIRTKPGLLLRTTSEEPIPFPSFPTSCEHEVTVGTNGWLISTLEFLGAPIQSVSAYLRIFRCSLALSFLLILFGTSTSSMALFRWPPSLVAWTVDWFLLNLLTAFFNVFLLLFATVSLPYRYVAFLIGIIDVMDAMISILLMIMERMKMPTTHTEFGTILMDDFYTRGVSVGLGINMWGVFAGINTGIQLVNVMYLFPHLKSFRLPFCLLLILNGGLHDPLGFAVGIAFAASGFYYMVIMYRSGRLSQFVDRILPPLGSGIKNRKESQDTLRVPTASPIPSPVDILKTILQLSNFFQSCGFLLSNREYLVSQVIERRRLLDQLFRPTRPSVGGRLSPPRTLDSEN
jgi:hypothetical protein